MVQCASNLSLNYFKKFKAINKDILPDLVQYIDDSKGSAYYKNHDNLKNWMTPTKKEKNVDEQLTSDIRTILNKICDENYEESLNELLGFKFESKQQYTILSDIMFKKIISDNNTKVYIRLIKDLLTHYIIEDGKQIKFTDLLLPQCRLSFIEVTSLKMVDNNINSEKFRYKDEILCFVRYIGELYNNKILSEKVIVWCITSIFTKIETKVENAYIIDILCLLFDTVYMVLRGTSEYIFESLVVLLEQLKDSNRITKAEKFLIMDVLEKF